MKLKIFNHSNSGRQRINEPLISVSPIGIIRFNKDLSELIGLEPKSKIEVAQSEINPKDWYLIPSKSDDAFLLRSDQRGFVLQNAYVARSIIKSIGAEIKTISFKVSKTSIAVDESADAKNNNNRMWLIITANPIRVMGNRTKK